MYKGLKIFLSGTGRSGGKKVLLELIRGLKEKGIYIEIVCLGSRGDYHDDFMRFSDNLRYIKIYEILNLDRTVKMVHFADSFIPVLALRIHSIFNYKMVCRYRFGALSSRPIEKFFYRLLLYDQSVVVPADNLRNDILKSLYKPYEVRVIRNFVSQVPLIERCSHKSIDVLTVARMIPRKRIDRVIALAGKFPQMTFVVVGDGPLLDSFRLRASSMSNLFFEGLINGPREYYQKSAIFYLPSYGEGHSFAVSEALMNGCKVMIHQDHGGNLEALTRNKNVMIIDEEDVSTHFKTLFKQQYDPTNDSSYSNDQMSFIADYMDFLCL